MPLFCQLPQTTWKTEVLKSINSRTIIWLESNLWRSSTCSKQGELQICIPLRLLWTLSSQKSLGWRFHGPSGLLIQEMDRLLHQDIHSLLKFPDLLKFPFLCIAAIDSFRGASGSITSITPCLKLVKCSNYVLPQHALPQVANPVLCAPSGAWAPTHPQNPGLDSPFVPHTAQVCVWSEQLCRGASQMGTAPSRHLLVRPFLTQPSR